MVFPENTGRPDNIAVRGCGVRQKTQAGVERRRSAGPQLRKKTKAEQRFQRAGFGGAWRAWVREHTSKKRFAEIDMNTEADHFRQAKRGHTSAYRDAERPGRAARESGKFGKKHGFGNSAKQAKRSRMAWARLCQSSLSPKQLDDPEGASMALVATSLASGATVVARRYQWRGMANGLRPCAATTWRIDGGRSLAEFESGKGKEIVHAVQQCCPDLSKFPMTALPTNFGAHVRVVMPTPEHLYRAVDWASKNSHASGLAVRLEEQWEKASPPNHGPWWRCWNRRAPIHEVLQRRGVLVLRGWHGTGSARNAFADLRQVDVPHKEWVPQGLWMPRDLKDFLSEEGGNDDQWLHVRSHQTTHPRLIHGTPLHKLLLGNRRKSAKAYPKPILWELFGYLWSAVAKTAALKGIWRASTVCETAS